MTRINLAVINAIRGPDGRADIGIPAGSAMVLVGETTQQACRLVAGPLPVILVSLGGTL